MKLKNVSLTLKTKLNLIFGVLFVVAIAFCGLFLSLLLRQNAESVVTDKALLLIETMSSVRDYTSTQVNPQLAPRLETEDEFIPQTVPAYSAREVFEGLRNKPEYRDFFYKEATLNPTNLRDKANEFEAQIINNFRVSPDLNQVTGFRSFSGGDLFYIARPLAVTKESCLRCHSTPQLAPRSQIATYGDKNGFGWHLNEIVGAKIISVPASKVLGFSRQLQAKILFLFVGIAIGAISLANWFLNEEILFPLKKISQICTRISTGDFTQTFKHNSSDEIGTLTNAISLIAKSLKIALDRFNKEKIDSFSIYDD